MAQRNPSEAAKWLAAVGPIPEFIVPRTLRSWHLRRQKIRGELFHLLGDLPPRPAVPRVKTISREDRGDFFLERFEFDNRAGSIVPGYLLLPKLSRAKKGPGVLYCHWHGGQYAVGKEEIFRTNAVPTAPGPELARRGYAVMAIDACGFGQRNGRGPGGAAERGAAGELTASKFNLWAGRTLWGMILRDDQMALDYFLSRPEIDRGRVGVTGMSMGATRSWWLLAVDERLRTAVAVGCLTRYQNLIRHQMLAAHGIYYFVPGMLRHFDAEAVVALAAPRPILFMTGDADRGSPVDGVREIERRVRPVYEMMKAGAQFRSEIYPGVGHVYLRPMWKKTLEWFDRHL